MIAAAPSLHSGRLNTVWPAFAVAGQVGATTMSRPSDAAGTNAT